MSRPTLRAIVADYRATLRETAAGELFDQDRPELGGRVLVSEVELGILLDAVSAVVAQSAVDALRCPLCPFCGLPQRPPSRRPGARRTSCEPAEVAVTRLRLIDCPRFFGGDSPTYQPGDCWYAREENGVYYWWADGHRTVKPPSSQYAEIAPEHAGKRPMIVVLPTGPTFCLHSPTYRDGKAGPSGWRVEGDLPNVTVHPSINYGEPGSRWHWHGGIKQGRMTP